MKKKVSTTIGGGLVSVKTIVPAEESRTVTITRDGHTLVSVFFAPGSANTIEQASRIASALDSKGVPCVQRGGQVLYVSTGVIELLDTDGVELTSLTESLELKVDVARQTVGGAFLGSLTTLVLGRLLKGN